MGGGGGIACFLTIQHNRTGLARDGRDVSCVIVCFSSVKEDAYFIVLTAAQQVSSDSAQICSDRQCLFTAHYLVLLY